MSWMNEYPRPQLRRNSFFSLNGEWQMDGGSIIVPFPPQSKLSGYKGKLNEDGKLNYTRAFELPQGFAAPGQRVRLHFGAVDQIADVAVNGKDVVHHEGGYLPFFADITDALREGENVLQVRVIDTLSHDYPYGKQRKDRGGMWYTPVSGIWQSVWMEAVPQQPVEKIRITPDMTGIDLIVQTKAKDCRVEIPGVGEWNIRPNVLERINVPEPKLWSPDSPHLYDITVIAGEDRVESYFALRKVEIKTVSGKPRVLLNGKPVFWNGLLDQGYFPNGIFLPNDPDFYAEEVRRMKALGVNLLRKHIKVEPETFYYACDKIGMLVMQDMVNNGGYNYFFDTVLPNAGVLWRPDWLTGFLGKKRKAFFTQHSLDIQQHLYNHPCVVSYTIFNEGWGQFNADKNYEIIQAADPTRIYDATSGWFWQNKSDMDSYHVYFKNKQLKGGKRPVLLSECGGYARPIPGHMFNESNKYGYGTEETEDALTARIEKMWDEMVLPSIPNGMFGVIYTQVSDVEDEINGLYTYDREICKVDAARMRALAKKADALIGQ